MDSLIKLLQEASRQNRIVYQQKQVRQQKQRDRQVSHAVHSEHDSSVGLDRLQLLSGKVVHAASLTNGARGNGDVVEFNRVGATADQMPHRKESKKADAVIRQFGVVKILFSTIQEDGIREFYVGGDRETPIKIFELPSSEFFEAYITNTGKTLNSWIASFRYAFSSGATTKIITPAQQWEYTTEQSRFTQYRGGGFWVSDVISADTNTGAYIKQNTGSAGELQCGSTTYYLSNQTITGIETGPITPSFLNGSVSASGSVTGGDDGGNPPIGIVTFEQISDLRTFEAVSFGLFKSEFNSISGSRTYSIEYSSSRGCNSGSSSDEQEEIFSGGTYLAPEIQKEYSKTQRSVYKTGSPDVNEEFLSYYSAIFSGTNSGSAIALKTNQTHLEYYSDAGLKLLTKTEDGVTETAIGSALPVINLATQNLVGSKIYQAPILPDYRTKKVTVELDVFTISSTIGKSKKNALVFSLNSPDCVVHSASAYL